VRERAASAEGLAAARGLLDSLGWHGVAMVEFKIDESGHVAHRINARFWGSCNSQWTVAQTSLVPVPDRRRRKP